MTVYGIYCTGDGLTKIGSESDSKPESRLRHLQVGNAAPLRLVFTRPGHRPEEVALHKRFAPKRVRGEWFALSWGDLIDLGWRPNETDLPDLRAEEFVTRKVAGVVPAGFLWPDGVDRISRVTEEIAHLTPVARFVVCARFFQDATIASLSRRLGLSLDVTRQIENIALQQLRTRLALDGRRLKFARARQVERARRRKAMEALYSGIIGDHDPIALDGPALLAEEPG